MLNQTIFFAWDMESDQCLLPHYEIYPARMRRSELEKSWKSKLNYISLEPE